MICSSWPSSLFLVVHFRMTSPGKYIVTVILGQMHSQSSFMFQVIFFVHGILSLSEKLKWSIFVCYAEDSYIFIMTHASSM